MSCPRGQGFRDSDQLVMSAVGAVCSGAVTAAGRRWRRDQEAASGAGQAPGGSAAERDAAAVT